MYVFHTRISAALVEVGWDVGYGGTKGSLCM